MPNIHYNMPFDEYCKVPGINASALKGAGRHSPLHLRAYLTGQIPSSDSDDMRFGRAAHCMILEPERFEGAFLVATGCRGVVKSKHNAPCDHSARYQSPVALRIDDQLEQVLHCLEQVGFVIREESKSGSNSVYLHRETGTLRDVRVSDHGPNEATAKWMDDIRCVDLRLGDPQSVLQQIAAVADGSYTPKLFWFCGNHKGKDGDYSEPVDYIDAEELGRLYSLRDALREADANQFLRRPGYSEAVITWEQCGFQMKSRLDRIAVECDAAGRPVRVTVVDLKKCGLGKAEYEAAQAQCAKLRYHIQAWFLYSAVRAVYGRDIEIEIHFVFIEDSPPHDVHVLTVSDQDILVADRDVVTQLTRYKRCERAGKFTGCQPYIDPEKKGILPARVIKYALMGE